MCHQQLALLHTWDWELQRSQWTPQGTGSPSWCLEIFELCFLAQEQLFWGQLLEEQQVSTVELWVPGIEFLPFSWLLKNCNQSDKVYERTGFFRLSSFSWDENFSLGYLSRSDVLCESQISQLLIWFTKNGWFLTFDSSLGRRGSHMDTTVYNSACWLRKGNAGFACRCVPGESRPQDRGPKWWPCNTRENTEKPNWVTDTCRAASHGLSGEPPAMTSFFCFYRLLHRRWWQRWLHHCPTLKDLHQTVWEAVFQDVPSAGLLCSGSGISLLFCRLSENLCFLPVDPVQAIMYVCSAIKEVLFVTHTHIHTWERKVSCVHVCVFWWFLASKLSQMLTARVNILLESSNKNTWNEWA